MKLVQKTVYSALAFLILLSGLGMKAVHAQITPASDGTGTKINQTPTQFDITGGTRAGGNLFHSFDRFGLNPGQTANFLSDPNIQNILGRITGGNPSVINGLIQITGGSANLFLMNPSGMIFGSGARLNVPAAFTATTASGIGFGNGWFNTIGNPNYAQLVGNPSEFAFASGGSLFNAGTLSAKSISLLGGTVVNTGTIESPSGNITIAAIPNQKLVRVTQAGSLLSMDLPQDGLTAKSLPELLTGGNLANATQATVENGVVKISGTPIATQPGSAIVSGQVSVAGETPGKIQVLGDRTHLINANLNASSATGGGTVLVGGEARGQGTTPKATTTIANAQTQISANATRQGAGGTVVLWSDDTTQVQSNISARGIDRGGFVETSGKQKLDTNGAIVNAGTTKGDPGTWLLDPTNINIANTGGTITPTQIAASLDAGTNVNLTTAGAGTDVGDITLTNTVNQTGGGTASLTLTGRRLLRPGSAVFNLSTAGDLTFNLNQVNPETTVPTSALIDAIDTIGTVPGNRIINLGAGTYTGNTLSIATRLTIRGTGATTILDGANARQVISIASGGNVTLDGLTIANGATTTSGAGILNNGITTLQNSIVQNNVASGSSSDGGGIYNRKLLTIDNTTIRNNTSGDDGGGIRNDSTLKITNSTISGNTAQGASSPFSGGGAILNTTSATATITNSTISSNTAKVGGAIRNDGILSLTSSTITANTGANGGGVVNTVNPPPPASPVQFGSTTLKNTIIAGNTDTTIDPTKKAPDVAAVAPGSFTDQGNNLIGIGDTFNSPFNSTTLRGTAASPLNPGLAPLGNYGGLTQTHALLPSSPAIEAGNKTIAPITDQTGQTRFGNTDIGAVEYQMKVVNTNDSGVGSLRNAINFANTATGTNTVLFKIPNSDPGYNSTQNVWTIAPSSALPTLTGSTIVDGWTQGGTGYNSTPLITVSGGNQFGVFSIAKTGVVTLNGLTIANGKATNGGGILNSGTLTVSNSTLSGNSATNLGGGILNSGTLTVSNSTLSGNSATNLGGGILNSAGTLTMSNSTLSGNSAGKGGGITNNAGTLTMSNSTFSSNLAAIGGGIWNNVGTLTMSNSTFSGNLAGIDGGGIMSGTNSLLTVSNSTFSGNLAGGEGGGIRNAGALTVSNSTFSGNSASIGGGISNIGTLTLSNNLIAGNAASSGREIYNNDTAGKVTSNGYNLFGFSKDSGLIGFTPAATNITPTAPLDQILSTTLANYGGSTQTLALLPGSPAINTGSAMGTPATDQRGLSRVGTPDIGAFESQGFTLTATSGTPQSTTVNTAFANPLVVKVVGNNPLEPVAGGTVTYTAPNTGASLNSASQTATINASGNANLPPTANTTAGSYTVSASSLGATGTANFSLTNTPDAVTRFDVLGFSSPTIAGNTGSFTVKAYDQFDNLATNYIGTVNFSSSDAQALLPSASTLTNGTGTFNASLRTAGTQSLTASDIKLSVNGSQTGITINPATPFSIIANGGGNQSTGINTAFKQSLQVLVRDQFGNPIANSNVIFSLPTQGASGLFNNGLSNITVNTDANGVAQVRVTANGIRGSFLGTASYSSLTPAEFSLSNLVGFTPSEGVRFNLDFFGVTVQDAPRLPLDRQPLLCAVGARGSKLDPYQGVPACSNQFSKH